MQNWIIKIKVDGINVDIVGPFISEAEADTFQQDVLSPNMPRAQFEIFDMTAPNVMKATLTGCKL